MDGVTYFGRIDGYLHAVDATSGGGQWKVQSPERKPVVPGLYMTAMATKPAVYDNVLFYFNGDALNTLKWR